MDALDVYSAGASWSQVILDVRQHQRAIGEPSDRPSCFPRSLQKGIEPLAGLFSDEVASELRVSQ
jgi:hypothetical protein